MHEHAALNMQSLFHIKTDCIYLPSFFEWLKKQNGGQWAENMCFGIGPWIRVKTLLTYLLYGAESFLIC
jgi:hypothetical protein